MTEFWLIMVGCLMGTLSGMVGIGGGIVAVPAMIVLLKMPASHAMGTSLAIIVPVALSGVYKHYTLGNIEWKAVLLIAISGMVCAYFGAWLNGKLPELWLKRVFGALIVIIGMSMVISKPKAKVESEPAPATPAVEQKN